MRNNGGIHTDGKHKLQIKHIICLLALLNFIGSFFYPVPSGMSDNGMIAVACLVLAITLWLTGVIPIALTSIGLVMMFVLLGITTFEETAGNLGNETCWLIFSMYMLNQTVTKTPLPRRLAGLLLSLSRGSAGVLLFSLMAFCFALSFVIPSTVGKIVLVIPICMEAIICVEEYGVKDFRRIAVPAITFMSTVGAFCLITGCPATLSASELFADVSYSWSYLSWLTINLPLGVAGLIVYAAVLSLLPAVKKAKKIDCTVITGKFAFEKNLSREEILVLVFYALLLTLWMTKDITGIPLAVSSSLIMFTAYIPGVTGLRWKDGLSNVDWNVIFVMVAGLSIAKALNNTGLSEWVVNLINTVGNGNDLLLLICLVVFIVLVRLFFVNNVMLIGLLLPVSFKAAVSVGLNPVWLGLITVHAINVCFFLPTQTAESMAVFSMNYHSFTDHIKYGSIMAAIMLILLFCIGFLYWPLAGIPVRL